MLTTPIPNLSETRDNATFDALLWALSRPGQVRDLPEAGEVPIVTALLDRECQAYSADPLLMPEIMRTGAELAELHEADHVFLGAAAAADVLTQIATGSDLYPDDGATVIVRGQIGEGQAVRLAGPGIDGALTVQLGGLPDGFWPARAASFRYPMGFDLFILDGARLIGVPRSTNVEVL